MADDAEAVAAAAAKAAADAAADAAKVKSDSQSEDDDDDVDDDSEDGLVKIDRIAKNMVEGKGGTYRKNSPEAQAIRKLLNQAFNLRTKNAALRARVSGDGDIVVRKGPEADQLTALRALGLTPAQVKEKLEQRDKFEATLKKHERQQTFNDVADGLGYSGRGKKAFLRQIEKEGIDLHMKEVEVEEDGKKSKVLRPFAKLPSEPLEKLRPIDEYVEAEMGDLIPAFKAEGSNDSDADDDSVEHRPHAGAGKVTPMVEQSASRRNVSEKKKLSATGENVISSRYNHLKRASPTK